MMEKNSIVSLALTARCIMNSRSLFFWRHTLEHPARSSLLAVGVGLVLVGLLVPLLNLWNGATGPLGTSIPLLFLIPVLVTSALGGRVAGVVVAVVAVFFWDWYLIQPIDQVTIASPRDLVALVVFLAVALLTGQLATAARRNAREALQRAHSSEALYELSTALVGHRQLDTILPILAQRLRDTFDLAACAVLLPEITGFSWRTAVVSGEMPGFLRIEGNREVAAMAAWANRRGEIGGMPAGYGMDAAHVEFLPLRAGCRSVGVLELVDKRGVVPQREREQLLITFANGMALALEQERLFEEERAAALARDSDRLKSALLSSVSHDLRTPLAGIKAAATSLMQEDVQWSEDDRRTFAADINAEVDRLTRLVSNLLDLSRIEAGAIVPVKEWEDVAELIDRVVNRLGALLREHTVRLDIAPQIPLVRLDAVQIEQVLTNLLENAAKYSPADTVIEVFASIQQAPDVPGRLRLGVSDHGPGIPVNERVKIFDTFYRLSGPSRRAGGTGMGLAIVRGLVEAHGGTVGMETGQGAGSMFLVEIPMDDGPEPGAPPSEKHPAAVEGVSP